MNFWTLRHPPIDRAGKCVGQAVALCTMTMDEAARTAVVSAPFKPVRVVSSDQPRCADLARVLAVEWGIDLTLTDRLREMSFGEWDGRLYDVIDQHDRVRWRAWCDDWKHASPPGGESLSAFHQRIRSWVEAGEFCPQTAVVTHAGVIRSMRVLSGMSWDDAMAEQHEYLGWTHHHFGR